MRKRSILIRAINWQLLFLYQLRHFQNRNLWYTFHMLFKRKRGLAHTWFLNQNESVRNFSSNEIRQMTTLLVL